MKYRITYRDRGTNVTYLSKDTEKSAQEVENELRENHTSIEWLRIRRISDKTRPFSLQEYTGQKVITKGGEDVQILCVNRQGGDSVIQPIVALVTDDFGVQRVNEYWSNGKISKDIFDSSSDLVFVSDEDSGEYYHELWVNLYRHLGTCEYMLDMSVFPTMQEALNQGNKERKDLKYIRTFKLAWGDEFSDNDTTF